jgi:hypothetical protein
MSDPLSLLEVDHSEHRLKEALAPLEPFSQNLKSAPMHVSNASVGEQILIKFCNISSFLIILPSSSSRKTFH